MGIEAVIFVELAAIAVLLIFWRSDVKELKQKLDVLKVAEKFLKDALADEQKRNDRLEAEIRRLRTISLTSKPERADTSVIKAKSAAQVRQITEERFGKQPEIGMEN